MTQKTEPLITIVTITFNLLKAGRERYFRQCLESVRNQTYKNIEHIVIDGASNDGTTNLIKEYADKGWITYISERDTGIYDAMNKGVKLARGKYVAFLNSDDYYSDNGGVAASVNALEESGADFSYAPVNMIKEDGSELDYEHPHCQPNIANVFFVMPFCHQTMFTKRSVMIKEGMFDHDFKSAGDYDFVMRLCLKKYKSVLVKDKFTTFRVGGLSDVNQQQSVDEVARSYYKNFSKFHSVTKRECENIYCRDFNGISLKLAKKLKQYDPYFNYDDYMKSVGPGVKMRKRLIFFLGRFKKGLKNVPRELYGKIKFLVFSPDKFIEKYTYRMIHGKFRQPIRKIYYALRLKKIKKHK